MWRGLLLPVVASPTHPDDSLDTSLPSPSQLQLGRRLSNILFLWVPPNTWVQSHEVTEAIPAVQSEWMVRTALGMRGMPMCAGLPSGHLSTTSACLLRRPGLGRAWGGSDYMCPSCAHAGRLQHTHPLPHSTVLVTGSSIKGNGSFNKQLLARRAG